ncbi:hypothetical protein VB636_00785, partial [Paracoccus sp. APAP_BH8]
AGAIRRPRIEPELFDPRTLTIVPRILMGMQSGDDAALRAVLDVFEEAAVRGAEDKIQHLAHHRAVLGLGKVPGGVAVMRQSSMRFRAICTPIWTIRPAGPDSSIISMIVGSVPILAPWKGGKE